MYNLDNKIKSVLYCFNSIPIYYIIFFIFIIIILVIFKNLLLILSNCFYIVSRNDYEDSALMSFYQISYLWYSAVGVFSVIIIGMLVSLVTGLQDVRKLNPKALSPLIHWIKPILPEGDLIGTEFVSNNGSILV